MTEQEQRLYAIGCTGLPLGDEFFKEFPDSQAMLPLALSLAVRRLVTIVCDKDAASKDVIPAARLIFLLNGKDVGPDGELGGLGGEGTGAELLKALERARAAE